MDQKIANRIRALENRTYVPYCSKAEYAKKLKMNGATLFINESGDLSFSGNVIGLNIQQDNNIKIEKNKNDIAALNIGKADVDHTHEIADVINLSETLDGKASMSHTHNIADVNSLQTTLDNKASINHTHTIASIDGLQTTLDGKASLLHTHTITNIQGLDDALDNKAPLNHTHTIANITDLQTTLDGKSDTNHTHTTFNNNIKINGNLSLDSPTNDSWSAPASFYSPSLSSGRNSVIRVGKIGGNKGCAQFGYYYNSDTTKAFASIGMWSADNLIVAYYDKVEIRVPLMITNSNNITAANVKSDNETRLAAAETAITGKAPLVHTHDISDVNSLQTTLDSKASLLHTHTIINIQGLDDALDNKAPLNHTHTIANVTNLQSTLDNKAAVDNKSIHYYFTGTRTQTWGMTSKYKIYTLGYVKSPNAGYRIFIGNIHVSVNCTSNISEEFDVVIRFGSGSSITGLSLTGNSLISNTRGKSGIGLILTDSTNMYYALNFYSEGYNNIDSIGCQINCVLPSALKLYSDSACTTAQVQERSNGLGNVDKEGYTFDSIYWNEETRALITHNHDSVYAAINHTHTISDITDYTPYDDTEIRNRVSTIEDELNPVDRYKVLITSYAGQGILLFDIHRKPCIQYNFGGGAEHVAEARSESETITLTVRVLPDRIFINLPKTFDDLGPWYVYLDNESLGTLITKQVYDRDTDNDDKFITQSMLLNLIYPVGSIYTSTVSTDPSTLFGGTWTAIVDRFLYCVDSTTTQSKQTGGSKQITVDNLPPHNHTINFQGWCNVGSGSDKQCINRTKISSDNVEQGPLSSSNTGSGTDYMPPYMTVFAWERTA